MTDFERNEISKLQQQGLGYKRISAILGLPVNGVKTYCRRHPAERIREAIIETPCQHCGTPVVQAAHRKHKRFCSDKCRMAWWNAHPDQLKRKTFKQAVCRHCGKEFQVYGNKQRLYCSRQCFYHNWDRGVKPNG